MTITESAAQNMLHSQKPNVRSHDIRIRQFNLHRVPLETDEPELLTFARAVNKAGAFKLFGYWGPE